MKTPSPLIPLLVIGGVGAVGLMVIAIAVSVMLSSGPSTAVPPDVAQDEQAAEAAEPRSQGSGSQRPRQVASGRTNPGLGDVGGMMNVRDQDFLEYDWERLAGYDCHFEYTYHAGDKKDVIRGTNQFTPTKLAPSAVLRNEGEERDRAGSGTGFLVHADGVIVTCAHVVEGAVEMEVVLDGGRKFKAEAIALDRRNDLALLKIEAKGLPTIALANSDEVSLAEEIRAVGFPLSDVLGESIKVTRGEVSGKIDRHGQQLLQIDASVNPGNSGGPVVDSRGNVVGITHALMTSDDISDVGFAIPSKFALELLKKKGVPASGQLETQSKTGPEVMRKVTPATVFIKVKIGPGGVGASTPSVVQFQGAMGGASGSAHQNLSPSINQRETGNLIVDDFGQISHNSGQHQLPLMMGQLGGVGIEPFPVDGSRSWHSVRFELLTINTSAMVPGGTASGLIHTPYGPRLGPRVNLPPRQTQVTLQLPIIEVSEYEIVSETSDTVRIKKTYKMASLDDLGGGLMEMEGAGTLIFSKKDRVPQKMDFEATLTLNHGDTKKDSKISLNYEFKPTGQARQTLAGNAGGGSREPYVPGRQTPEERAQMAANTGRPPSGQSRPAADGKRRIDPNDLPPVRKVDIPLETEGNQSTGPIQGLNRFEPEA